MSCEKFSIAITIAGQEKWHVVHHLFCYWLWGRKTFPLQDIKCTLRTVNSGVSAAPMANSIQFPLSPVGQCLRLTVHFLISAWAARRDQNQSCRWIM